ncbi:MAG: hscB [Rickettsiaceae bacterium]|jgi:molecular chaperone HscB|nr:hscB [Rickettsiaceae bacterium]
MLLDKLNHFEKFNLPTSFQIDEEKLENQYLKLQQQFHPDVTKDQTESEINSILINQAYQILKNPLKRVIYFLQLQNMDIEDEKCSVKPAQETLIFVMNLREEILENQNDQAAINEIKQKIKNLISEEMPKITELLAKNNFQEAAQMLIKMKYLDKIILDLKKPG